MAGMYVGPHAAPVADPAALTEAEAAHAAGVQAALDRRAHYHEQVLGQGSQAGDPQPAESASTLQSTPGSRPGEGRSTL